MRVLTVTDSVIDGLSKQSDMTTILPSLNALKKKKKSCGCTGRARKLRNEYLRVKQQIIGLPSEKLAQLKSSLNVQKIVVYLKNGKNKTAKTEV